MLDLQPATFDDFLREATRGNVVPVVRSVLADLQTPVGAYLHIAEGVRYSFLLESIEGGERLARYSFLGANPEMIVRGLGNDTVIERNGEREIRKGVRATTFARDYFRDRELARRSGLAPLAGGAVGYLAYEAARWFEPTLADKLGRELETDDAVWMFYRTVLAFDRVRQRLEITAIVLTEEAEGSHERLRELYEQAIKETERVERLLEQGIATQIQKRESAEPKASFESNWTRQKFEDAVRSVQEHIAAGDCYQVVLSQRFTKRVKTDALSIYR